MFALQTLPEPSAHGTLSSRPLEHLLLYVRQKSLTGSLVLEAEGCALYFERGNLRKVLADGPTLSTVVYEQGLINDAALNESLNALAKTRARYGAILIDMGVISREQLFDALSEQATRKVAQLMGLPPATLWSFQENFDVLEGYGGTDWPLVDPLGGVWRGIKAHVGEESMGRVTKRAKAARLSLRPSSGVAMSYLSEDERTFAIRLGEGRLYTAIASNLNELTRSRIVYFLMLASALEVSASEPTFAAVPDAAPHSNFPPGRTSGVMPAQHPSFRMPAVFAGQAIERAAAATPNAVQPVTNAVRPAPAASDATLTLRKREILDLAAKAEGTDLFALFGVTATSSTDEIRAQFLRIMRTVHPDRLPEELQSLAPMATRIVVRLNEAYAILSDPKKRAALNTQVAAVQKDDALTLSRQALKMLERDLPGALQLAKRASELGDNDDSEIQFACAWILAHEETEQSDEGLRGSVIVLDRLLREHGDYAMGFYYRAQLHKRLGNATHVIRDLKAAVEHDEDHLEATRELRLFRMRIDGGMTPEEALGISGKGPTRNDSIGKLLATLRGK
jgi:hypothetical protein